MYELLHELNPEDVTGSWSLELERKTKTGLDKSFTEGYSLVIAGNVDNHLALECSKLCRKQGIPLVLLR